MVSYGETSLKDAVNKALLGVSAEAGTSAVAAPSCALPMTAQTTTNDTHDATSPVALELGQRNQTVHKWFTKSNANGSQMVSKRFQNRLQNGCQMVSKRFQNGSQIMETVPKLPSKRFPNGSKMGDEFQTFSSLSPPQRTLLKTLFLSAKANGSSTTQRLSKSYISELSGIGKSSVKTGIWRLRKKGLLETKEYKIGRDGWASYEIPQSVYFEIFNSENGPKISNKSVPKPTSKPTPGAPYSSSTLNINTTTGDEESSDSCSESELPEAWQSIDIDSLKQIGFSQRHLQTVYAGGLANPQTVQESINHYAWGLANNADAYKQYPNLLRPLIGVLKKGGAWVESGYESPQSIALKTVTQLQDKRRRQEKERIDELMKIEFPTWRDLVGQDRLDEIAPKGCIGGISGKQILWQEHFRRHVLLPKLRAEGAIEFYDSYMAQPSVRAASK